MLSVNEVTLLGHVGRDPEIRTMQNGDEVANVSLATGVKYKDAAGTEHKYTEWHRVVVFGRQVAVVKDYVRKGHKLMFCGTLRTRKWADKDGVDRWTTEIRVSDGRGMVNLLESRSDSQEEDHLEHATEAGPPPDGDEIPF